MLRRYVFQRREIVNARVVDENIELVECLFRFDKETIDLGRLGEIGLNSDSLAAFAFNLLDDAIGTLLTGGIIDDYGSAFRGQLPGDGRTDAFGSTRNDRHFALQLLRHDWTP